MKEKRQWIGEKYTTEGKDGNDVEKTNVPYIRMVYRQDTLEAELNYMMRGAQKLETVRS